jgi:glucosamine--fructose-6-phosphate aminotransferase (isomerizing)
MCGIMGYVGARPVARDVVLGGLKSLEYRGYDSAGIAIVQDGALWVEKRAGKIDELIRVLDPGAPQGTTAIGHTRWATHGRPTDENAHPHFDCTNTLAVIHNGIIENYRPLKEQLMAEGHEFRSQTDTEVLAHLIEKGFQAQGDLGAAVREALRQVHGAYAIVVVSHLAPGEIVAAKTASPLVIGLSDDENYLASDVPALLPHTKRMLFLSDGEIAVIQQDAVSIMDFEGREIERSPTLIQWDPVTAQKQGYKHFMLKEIHEQPQAVANTLHGRLDLETGDLHLEEIGLSPEGIRGITSITLIGCGTAYHAAWTAKYLWQRTLDLPVSAELASEFRYSNPYLSDKTLVIAVSQSGETADTLMGVRLARERGAPVLAITNTLGSTISRESDWTLYTHAGPEIGVASTKCFMVQLAALALVGLYISHHRRRLSRTQIREELERLAKAPSLLERVLRLEADVERLAQAFYDKANFLFLGRDMLCPIAFEGALKLKEISYIHAEGYAAGEMKHGPIALIDEHMPVVVLVTKNSVYDKVFSNIEEVKARKGIVIALSDTPSPDLERVADHLIKIPEAPPLLTPMLFAVPLQLLAYHIGVLRGTDVDQPRNLAKSVTVE